MVPKSSNYKIQGTSNGHQMLYIYILKIIEIFNNLFLNNNKMKPNSSNYNTRNIYWPPYVNTILIFLQRD